jgi:sialic acid synthase SpsE
MIEKHLTLARADGGPDAGFSMEPDEFASLVRDCRSAWEATQAVETSRRACEEPCRRFRRSLFVVSDMKAGDVFTPANVCSIRPEDGLAPKHLRSVLGRRSSRPIERGTPLAWDLIADETPPNA